VNETKHQQRICRMAQEFEQPEARIAADDCREPPGVVSMPPQMSSQPTHAEGQPIAADCADLVALEQRREKTRALKQAMIANSSPAAPG
jgi:hypothetical protein